MLYHIKEANAVFMTKDFNNDGVSDCVGLEVSALSILESPESYVNILLGEYQEPEARPSCNNCCKKHQLCRISSEDSLATTLQATAWDYSSLIDSSKILF